MTSAIVLAVASFAGVVALLFGVPTISHRLAGTRERTRQKKRYRRRRPPEVN